MTGAELRAWRERLGKDEAWAAALLESLPGAPASAEIGCGPGQGLIRLRAAESVADGYAYHAFLRKTLRAALEAEERAQARITQGKDVWGTRVGIKGHGYFMLLVHPCGRIEPLGQNDDPTPALLRYVADLSECRAALHAASDRQRKLDAVELAQKAKDAACEARDKADGYARDAHRLAEQAQHALDAARREAGL